MTFRTPAMRARGSPLCKPISPSCAVCSVSSARCRISAVVFFDAVTDASLCGLTRLGFNPFFEANGGVDSRGDAWPVHGV